MGAPPTGSKIHQETVVKAFSLEAAFQHTKKNTFCAKMSQLARNMGPTCAQHGDIWKLKTSKKSNSRSASPLICEKSPNRCPSSPHNPPKHHPKQSKTQAQRKQKAMQKQAKCKERATKDTKENRNIQTKTSKTQPSILNQFSHGSFRSLCWACFQHRFAITFLFAFVCQLSTQ